MCPEPCCAVSGSAATTARLAPSPGARAARYVPVAAPASCPASQWVPAQAANSTSLCLHSAHALPIPRYSLHGDLPGEEETTFALPFAEPAQPARTLSSSVLCCMWA